MEKKLTSKHLLARPLRENRHVRQRMHPLRIVHGKRPVDEKPRHRVLVIGDVVVLGRRRVDGRYPRAGFVYLVVLPVIWEGGDAGEEGVATRRRC